MNPLNMTRVEKWHYVISSLIGGNSDSGVIQWLALHENPSLDELFMEAVKLRDGMIST